MEFSLDVDLNNISDLQVEDMLSKYEKISESVIIPRSGIFLGLDISEDSSGVCLYKDGVKLTANISLETKESETFREVLLRRELKSYLSELIGGLSLDLIIIEDAYQGINPKTTRTLYAINTAIDEMILDGVCSCSKFLRIANGTWKSWLYTIDTEKRYSGLKDKERIRRCLELIGITELGEGYQDRLDATGMLIGYFLKGRNEKEKPKYQISTTNIVVSYEEAKEFIIDSAREERKCDEVEIKEIDIGRKSITKKLMLEYIKDNPKPIYIIDFELVLGMNYKSLGLTSGCSRGYIGFWLSRTKLSKLEKEDLI